MGASAMLWLFVLACSGPTQPKTSSSVSPPTPASSTAASPSRTTVGKGAIPSPAGAFAVDLTLSGAVTGHLTTVGTSVCAGSKPGSIAYWTRVVAVLGSQTVTFQIMLLAPDYKGPGTYPAYREVGNGGAEGLTVGFEPGDYFAQQPPNRSAGTFTIAADGASGTANAVALKGNYSGALQVSGTWRCR